MIIFADRHTINQSLNSKTEATLSTVVCGSSGSGPIKGKEEDEERNDNICPQTINQAIREFKN